MPTNLATSSALKPKAAARSRSTRTDSSLFWSPALTRTSRSCGLLDSIGTMSLAISARVSVESPTSCTCTFSPGWPPPPGPPPPPLPMPIVGARGLGQRLADFVDQRLGRRLTSSIVELDPCARVALLAVPGIDLLDVEALAVGVEELLDPEHFVGHLLQAVGALPLVEDVGLAAIVAAEHVLLGQHHRHDADRDDQQDRPARSSHDGPASSATGRHSGSACAG